MKVYVDNPGSLYHECSGELVAQGTHFSTIEWEGLRLVIHNDYVKKATKDYSVAFVAFVVGGSVALAASLMWWASTVP